jgi:DNA-binding NtrC family response regulator
MKGSILVVDDERTICIAIQRLLKGCGYEVSTASSGEEAIRELQETPHHLVITDLSLKGKTGLDVLRWVKEEAPATAVIVITAYGSEKIAVDAMKLGAADYLPKPFDNDELELVVERVFEDMALRRDLRAFQGKRRTPIASRTSSAKARPCSVSSTSSVRLRGPT